jgi:hypothetical protein
VGTPPVTAEDSAAAGARSGVAFSGDAMNETLNEATELLGRLRFETGGSLLEHIVALERELAAERERRLDELRKAGMTDVQIGFASDDSRPPAVHRLAHAGGLCDDR